ncbi:hypothetical protein O988_01616 [Pseudogymnoascus sp. VKM F-3808]|nr:hypothetical protein O988_01616 [Pseudogymnoascus sp. VKM F-3808]
MKLSYALAFLLPVAALANPIPEPEAEVAQSDDVKNFTKFNKIALRDKAAEDVGIAARATVTCAIVNVVTTVGCRWYPWHTGWNGKASSEEKEDFGPGTKHDFECYQVGECIGGNCMVAMFQDTILTPNAPRPHLACAPSSKQAPSHKQLVSPPGLFPLAPPSFGDVYSRPEAGRRASLEGLNIKG